MARSCQWLEATRDGLGSVPNLPPELPGPPRPLLPEEGPLESPGPPRGPSLPLDRPRCANGAGAGPASEELVPLLPLPDRGPPSNVPGVARGDGLGAAAPGTGTRAATGAARAGAGAAAGSARRLESVFVPSPSVMEPAAAPSSSPQLSIKHKEVWLQASPPEQLLSESDCLAATRSTRRKSPPLQSHLANPQMAGCRVHAAASQGSNPPSNWEQDGCPHTA